MKKLFFLLPGVLLCFAISIPAWFLGNRFPLIGSPIFSIVAGILIISLFQKQIKKSSLDFTNGIKFASKKILQYSIILLGFGMNLHLVASAGKESLYIILIILGAALLSAAIVGKALKLSKNTTTLIGVGTAICGGSAIAATAPVIKAKDEEVAHAISTIFLFNIIAVFVFPLLGRLMGMSDINFGIWAGTAINDTSSVAAAGASWSASVGNNVALEYATIVKLTRTLMIVPIVLGLALFHAALSRRAGDCGLNKPTEAGGFSFINVFPWFVVFFFAAATLNTFFTIPVSAELSALGKFLIVTAMAGIGLNTDIKSFISSGIKPILLGLLCWVTISIVSFCLLMS